MGLTNMSRALLLTLSAGLGLGVVAPAYAQDFSLPPLINDVGMGNIAIGAAAQGHVRKSLQERSDEALTEREPDFSYRYSRPRMQQNLRAFVERTPANAGRADLERLFTNQPLIIEEIAGAMRGYDFDPHNSADAYAFWWINAWLAANKRNDDPNPATIEAVKRQARSTFAATPGFAETSDAGRQQYAEALMLQAVLISAAFDQSKGNSAQLEQLASAVRQGARASGLDLAQMTLTKDGFVPR